MVLYELASDDGFTITVGKSCDCHYVVTIKDSPMKFDIPIFSLIQVFKQFNIPFEQIPRDLYFWFPGYDREKNLLDIKL